MNRSPLRSLQSAPRLTRCALAVALLAAGAAHAQDDGMGIRFSGFGTVGVAHSSEKNADFVSVADQPNGAGHTRNWDFRPDTKLGGQADVKFNAQFSATAQLLAHERYDNTYTPELMMAFGKWQATPELAVRAGRLPIPVFLISDSRTVGYSQTWVRPPVDMYHNFSFYYFDGADLTWATNVNNIALKSQVYGGTLKVNLPAEAVAKLSPIVGANLTAEVGDLTMRVSYLSTKLSVSSPALTGVFQGVRFGFPAGSLGPGAPAIPGDAVLADQFELTKKQISYTSLGFNYDPGRWFVTGELGRSTEAGYLLRVTYSYLLGGMRFGAFVPYLAVSRNETKIAGSTTGNPVLDAVRAATAATGQKSLALGLRWDAMKNVAVKTQFDRSKPDSGSNGQLSNVQPDFQPGKAYSVVSVAVDFVF